MNVTIQPAEVVFAIVAVLVVIGIAVAAVFMWSQKGRKP